MAVAAISGERRVEIFGPPGQVPTKSVMTPWGIKVTAHELVADRFLVACKDAAKLDWKPQRIDSFNNRPIRGKDGFEDRMPGVLDLDEWSLHAWALAWDFFVTPPDVPPPGGVWTPDNPVPPNFAACFTRQGFRWGKHFPRVDIPHIEWAAAIPGTPIPPLEEDDMTEQEKQALFDAISEMRENLRKVTEAVARLEAKK